ncbi:MAG TPA: glycoside hydrolase family 97 protein [Chryseosolibacter sp.]|nr:glycoside hydrolase family 97 protein [Chryseosolibacter sp.]
MNQSSFRILALALHLLIAPCAASKDRTLSVTSPDGSLKVTFELREKIPYYSLSKNEWQVIQPSKLGFLLKNLPALSGTFEIVSSASSSVDETWTQPWGEVKQVRNHHNQLLVHLLDGMKRKLSIEFRVFNDGMGFRYHVPAQKSLKDFVIMDELTEFAFAQDLSAWWIPAYGDEMDSEYLYNNSRLSEIKQKVTTPVTLESPGLVVSIHEAALVDYAGMALENMGGLKFKADLVPWSDGERVKTSAPMTSPWRTIQVGTNAGDLVTSPLILNLNEPCRLNDVSWIKPGKYMGVWWGMHLQRNTWEQGPNHGATTANVKSLIDFASAHKFAGVLAEGWNEGWEGDWTQGGNFNFTKSYPDFDLAALSKYAREKNIALIAHHETGGNVSNYERQLDDAFRLLREHDIHYLKTGYVNKLPAGERHQGQFMVRHYHKVMETAAKYKVMLDVHEPVKDTGLRRTFPNMMTREGARGTEYEAWSSGNPPSHTTILPFTRCLAGPLDYTPGIFDILFKNRGSFRVHTTLAKQLALYVVLYSPLHMAADLPENYNGHPAFKFIEDVPTDWEYTRVVNGEIGKFVTIARKDRHSNQWFVGSITNEEPREISLPLDFLDQGKKYTAEVYTDGQNADFSNNPLDFEIRHTAAVDNQTTLKLRLAPGGGTAIRFFENTTGK